MALFNRNADDAVKAGISRLQTLTKYNQLRQNQGYAPINTSSLIFGTVGDQNRIDGRVISDAVNLASRIESLTKTYGVPMLISQLFRTWKLPINMISASYIV